MKPFKKITLMFIMSVLVVFAAACGSSSTNNNADEGKQSDKTENKASGSLTISGSSAMQPLVLAAAEKFMDENPDADIQVQAGGSGTGLYGISWTWPSMAMTNLSFRMPTELRLSSICFVS